MKKYDLMKAGEELVELGGSLQVSQIIPILTLKALEHYSREHLKVIRMLRAKYQDPFDIKIQTDLAIKNTTDQLTKYGLKEREDVKLDLI